MNKLSLPMLVTPETLRSLMLPLAWKKILQGLEEKKLTVLSVRCAETTIEHFDPVPKPTIAAQFNGPVVIRWDLSAPEIPPVSARTGLRSTSSDGSNGSASSSVIEDGERPPSA